jgi:hypothetical protein
MPFTAKPMTRICIGIVHKIFEQKIQLQRMPLKLQQIIFWVFAKKKNCKNTSFIFVISAYLSVLSVRLSLCKTWKPLNRFLWNQIPKSFIKFHRQVTSIFKIDNRQITTNKLAPPVTLVTWQTVVLSLVRGTHCLHWGFPRFSQSAQTNSCGEP